MNSILTMDVDEGKISFIIPYIVFVNQKDNQVEVILNCPSPKSIYSINFPGKLEAEGAYLRIISLISSYYDSMMPQKNDNQQDNTDEIKIAQEYEKRANETVSSLANFIKMLFDQISRDWKYKPNNLEEKMDCLKLWVTARVKECK